MCIFCICMHMYLCWVKDDIVNSIVTVNNGCIKIAKLLRYNNMVCW